MRKKSMIIFLLSLALIPIFFNVWTRIWWESDNQEGAFYINENGKYINVCDSEKHLKSFLTQSGTCIIVLIFSAIIVVLSDKKLPNQSLKGRM